MYGSRIDAISGNFVTARPYGIRGGVDYQMTGEVRSIDVDAIRHNLDNDHIVLLDRRVFRLRVKFLIYWQKMWR